MESHKCREACSVPFKYLGEEIPCPSNFSAGDKKLTRPCRYIECKCVSVACDCAPINGSRNSNSGVDERAIDKSNFATIDEVFSVRVSVVPTS